MTVSATSPINTTAAATNDTTSAGRTRLAENFDMFLTLLTTQLKNQDPTAPMDSNQFMAQLVQMTSVEQQLAGNELLKQLVANTGTNFGAIVGLIGKEVRAATDEAKLAGGQAKWGYNLPTEAADVKLEILDTNGVTVRTISGSTADRKAGDHALVWDGKDAAGHNMADGVYTLKVTAKDAKGETLPSSTYVQGLVSAIEQQDGQGLITINGGKVAINLITSIAQAPAGDGGTAPTGGSNNNTSGSGDGEAATDPDPTNPADQTSA